MLQTAFVEKHFDTIAKLKKKVGENMEEPKYNISFSVTPLKDVTSVCYSWYNGLGTSGSPLGLRSNRSLAGWWSSLHQHYHSYFIVIVMFFSL